MGPTYMIDKVYFFAFYEQSGFKDIMFHTLKQYIPNIDLTSYRDNYIIKSDSPFEKDDADIMLFSIRNKYFSPKWVIFVENLTYDIGAAVRVRAAIMNIRLKMENNRGIILICLVRNLKEAKFFYDFLGMQEIDRPNADFKILFLDICPIMEDVDYYNGFRTLPERLTPEISPHYALTPSGKQIKVNISKHYKE